MIARVRGLVGRYRLAQLLGEVGVLPQDFALEPVALLDRHRRHVESIRGRDGLDRLLRPAVHARDPCIGSAISVVRITRSDSGQIGRYDFVRVLLELPRQLVPTPRAPRVARNRGGTGAGLTLFTRTHA
jgi:hypothetical protein